MAGGFQAATVMWQTTAMSANAVKSGSGQRSRTLSRRGQGPARRSNFSANYAASIVMPFRYGCLAVEVDSPGIVGHSSADA